MSQDFSNCVNPYVCRLLIRADRWLYRLRGRKAEWFAGRLCFHYSSGSRVEVRSHFPGWMFRAAAAIQNRWPATRRVLSW